MTDQEFKTAVLQRFDGIDQRLDGIDQRLDGIEGDLQAVKTHLGVDDERTNLAAAAAAASQSPS